MSNFLLIVIAGFAIYFAIRPDKLRMVADKICEWRGHRPSDDHKDGE